MREFSHNAGSPPGAAQAAAGVLDRLPPGGRELRMDGIADWCPVVAIFLVYANAVVVAVHFHGAPGVVGGVIPMLFALPIAMRILGQGAPLWFTARLAWAMAFALVRPLKPLSLPFNFCMVNFAALIEIVNNLGGRNIGPWSTSHEPDTGEAAQ